MRLRFLIDESLSPRLKAAVLRYRAAVDIIRVGDEGAPPLGALDPEILRYVESTRRVLITGNRVSIPLHAAAHFAAGGHHWGVVQTRPSAGVGQLAEAVILLWEASEAEEWLDRVEWIPL